MQSSLPKAMSGTMVSGWSQTPIPMISPRLGARATHSCIRPGLPTHSNWIAGGSLSKAMHCALTSPVGSTKSWNPNVRAMASRASDISLITTLAAPKKRHQIAQVKPMGPAPIISTVLPATLPAILTECKPTASGSTRAPSRLFISGGSLTTRS